MKGLKKIPEQKNNTPLSKDFSQLTKEVNQPRGFDLMSTFSQFAAFDQKIGVQKTKFDGDNVIAR